MLAFECGFSVKRPTPTTLLLGTADRGVLYDPVASIRRIGSADVYSLRVDSDEHAFITNGFVSHNTECRLTPAAMDMLDEVDEDTVDLIDAYTGEDLEPIVLPARLPNLLVNGSEGIAVGISTHVPPHNLGEVLAACRHLLLHPDATVDDLRKFVLGPDFPSGGTIIGDFSDLYNTGRQNFKVRGNATVDTSGRRATITFKELPYLLDPAALVTGVRALADGELSGVASIEDYTDALHPLEVVIEVKPGFDPYVIVEKLWHYTKAEVTYPAQMKALVKGVPALLNLKTACQVWLDHRLEVIERRSRFRRAKAAKALHLVEVLERAYPVIDEVIAIIKKAENAEQARTRLQKLLKADEVQANHVLRMPLGNLNKLVTKDLVAEANKLRATIKGLDELLGSDGARRKALAEEIGLMIEKYPTPRRTRIVASVEAMPKSAVTAPVAAELPDAPCSVLLTPAGLARIGGSLPADQPKRSKRSLAAVCQAPAMLRGKVAVISSSGDWLEVPVVELPDLSLGSGLDPAPASEFGTFDGTPVAVLDIREDAPLAVICASGQVKRLKLGALPKKAGQKVVTLDDDDRVVAAGWASDDDFLVLVTDSAQMLRLPASTVNPKGADAGPMAGMNLDGAKVLAAAVVTAASAAMVATVTDGGHGKLSAVSECPTKGRGSIGVRCHTFRKADTKLTAAYVGDRPGVAGKAGSAALLGWEPLKLSASGQPVDTTVFVHTSTAF